MSWWCMISSRDCSGIYSEDLSENPLEGDRAGIRNADHIVAISSSTKHDLMTQLGIAEEKILVAHIGLSPAFETVCTEDRVDSVLAKYHLDRGYVYHGGDWK